MSTVRYGADLVTFYSPAWWGFHSDTELQAWARENPQELWKRILDGLTAARISAIEMTFAPADWHSAVAAFGSAEAFRAELDRRGLSLLSGFLLIQHWYPGEPTEALMAEAECYAAFMSAAGGAHLVVGLPIRRDLDQSPQETAADPLLQHTVSLLKQLVAILGRHGVRLAVHTEAHSFLGSAASIDTIMSLTNAEDVSLCVDSAHLVLAGEDPAQVVRRYAHRTTLAHWKDADGPMDPAPSLAQGQIMHDLHFLHMRKIGTGVVDWANWATALELTEARSVRLLELDVSPQPEEDLLTSRTYVEGVRPVR